MAIFKPEIVYVRGGFVPAKNLNYKIDKNDKKKVKVWELPRTRDFEKKLAVDLKKELRGVRIFPTRKEVVVLFTYGIHVKRRYESCDIDNTVKTVLDALKRVVYYDDKQVKVLFADKIFLQNEEASWFLIEVKLLYTPSKKPFVIRKHIWQYGVKKR